MTHPAPTLRAFLDAAAKLRYLERDQFEAALAAASGGAPSLGWDKSRWERFEADPCLWLAKAPDALGQAVWEIAQGDAG